MSGRSNSNFQNVKEIKYKSEENYINTEEKCMLFLKEWQKCTKKQTQTGENDNNVNEFAIFCVGFYIQIAQK